MRKLHDAWLADVYGGTAGHLSVHGHRARPLQPVRPVCLDAGSVRQYDAARAILIRSTTHDQPLRDEGHDAATLPVDMTGTKQGTPISPHAGGVQTVSTPSTLRALLQRVGLVDQWEALSELDVSVRVLGSVFDCEGYPVGSVPPYPEVEEQTVCFYKEGVYLGAILLADLCRLAVSAAAPPPPQVLVALRPRTVGSCSGQSNG